MTIRYGHRELSKEKVAWYINGLRFNIQDEVGMLKIDLDEEIKEVPEGKRIRIAH